MCYNSVADTTGLYLHSLLPSKIAKSSEIRTMFQCLCCIIQSTRHPSIFFQVSVHSFCHPKTTCFISLSSCILHISPKSEDVLFPLHHSLHHVDVCVRSFYDVFRPIRKPLLPLLSVYSTLCAITHSVQCESKNPPGGPDILSFFSTNG